MKKLYNKCLNLQPHSLLSNKDFILGCNEDLIAEEAKTEYTSPGFPHYGNNIFCTIEIIPSNDDKCIEIDFTAFHIEDETDCE